jgi:cytochrome c peroxidase
MIIMKMKNIIVYFRYTSNNTTGYMYLFHKGCFNTVAPVMLFFIVTASFLNACDAFEKKAGREIISSSTDSLKIELGRRLFYDKDLSLNSTKSCASCHNPSFAFSDGYRTSTTALGQTLLHNAPGLINTTFYRFYDWADTGINHYSKQIKRPLYSNHPVELGLNVEIQRKIALLEKNNTYKNLFAGIYTSNPAITTGNIEDAIIAFVQSLQSFRSPYDHFMAGDISAMTSEAQQGMQLFFSARLQCGSCHKAPLFTSNDSRYALPADSIYFNTGLYNIKGRYPAGDEGLFEHTRRASDIGRFKTPSLRNIALTAPYFHDGSAASLTEVIDIYSRGGRKIVAGPTTGDGKDNPHKDRRVNGFTLNTAERRALIAFLYALTDSSVLTNPAFQPLH